MNRPISIRLVALLLALATLVGSALGAGLHSSYLPIVLGQPSAAICDASAPLLDQDTGLLSAGYRDGAYIIAYQDRAHGSLAHVVRHVGNHLEDEPVQPARQVAPMFSPPGPKQGSLALVLNGPRPRLYYTQRKLGDTTGPYGIWCIEW